MGIAIERSDDGSQAKGVKIVRIAAKKKCSTYVQDRSC